MPVTHCHPGPCILSNCCSTAYAKFYETEKIRHEIYTKFTCLYGMLLCNLTHKILPLLSMLEWSLDMVVEMLNVSLVINP